MSDHLVSAGEAARRLGVAPVTIQRWVDNGILTAERTVGGHRRIPLSDIQRLLSTSQSVRPSTPIARWVDVLVSGEAREIKAALIDARVRLGSWALVADKIASALVTLGRRWEAGLCEVYEEHRTVEALRRGLAACAGEIYANEHAPRVALFTAYGERHTLGLSLAELVFAEAGWKVFFIGEGPPVSNLTGLTDALKPDIITVSASPAARPATISAYQASLARLVQRHRVRVILGGGGPWTSSDAMMRVTSFQELCAFLKAEDLSL